MPREDLIIKHEREVTKLGTYQERLELRYKRVIDDLRRQVIWWKNNSWKSLFLKIVNKIKRSVMKK